MRTYQHVIDTQSIKRVLHLLPDHWVVRELTERDYGIDLIVEIFINIGEDKHGHTVFNSTGAVFHAQVKGTASKLEPTQDGDFSFQLNKSAMLYAERFSVPFLLFRVDVSTSDAKSYFLWIQRYVRDVLDSTNPTWRTDSQDSYAIRIPPHNEISSSLEKIERIAMRPRMIQELVEFRESYFNLTSQLDSAYNGQLEINIDSLNHLALLARRINNLATLLKYNDCSIDKSCTMELLSFVESLDQFSNLSTYSEIPHRYNFDLLASSVEGLTSVEDFIASNDDGTVY